MNKKISVLLSLTGILFFMGVSGLQAQFQMSSSDPFGMNTGKKTYKLAGVTVEGNNYVSDETIIAIAALYPGKELVFPLDGNDLAYRTAIQNLWKRDEFSKVEITVDRVIGEELFLLIEVSEWNRVGGVSISNNKKIDLEDIETALDKNTGDVVSHYDLYRAEKQIRNLYLEDGYALDTIDIKLKKLDNSMYDSMLVYIEEGPKLKVKEIIFNGNVELTDKELIKAMEENDTKSWWEFWKSSKYLANELENDRKLMESYCHEMGYVDAIIEEPKVEIDKENKSVKLVFNMTEGQKQYIRNITFTGNTVFDVDALSNRLDFEKGEPYDTKRFEANLFGNEKQDDALSLYLDNGYLRANFVPQETRIGTDSVDVEVRVMEFDRYKFNRVSIEGNDRTLDKVIRRDLYTVPGDYFSRSAVIRSIRQLNVMNYFNPENLTPEIQPAVADATTVDVVYNVEERSTDTINASVGFAGSFGLMVQAGLTFNNFSIKEPFRAGGGQRLNLSVQYGQQNMYNSFSIGFTEPWLFDKPTTVGVVAYSRYQNYSTINLRSQGITTNFGRRFKWPDDYWRGDWSLRFQLNDNMLENQYYSYYYRNGKYTELTLDQRFSRTSQNHMFFPSYGSRFELQTAFAMGAIGVGETDYLKNEIKFDMYNPLWSYEGQNKLVFMSSVNVGYVTGIQTDTTMNQIELYRMGGNGLSGFGTIPLRGYPDNGIGSQYGNKLMSKYVAELRFALSMDPMPVYFYAFAEAGNVWVDMENCNPFELKRSAGVGVQMMIQALGNIGFSYGYGFDAIETGAGDSGWKFLFHLGGM
jgi:outer membrane protein insertion porin family